MSKTILSILAICLFTIAAGKAEERLATAEDSNAKLLVRPDFFKTLVNPQCSHCVDEAKRRAGELRDDDRVLAWTRGKYDGGAIPLRFFLAPYRVISDSYGVFVYDADAGFLRGYEPSYDFTFYGWRNGVMAIRHKDGTIFSALSGLAFDGPRKGERLKPIATIPSDWGFWLKAHPGTVAYHMFDKYQPMELPKSQTPESVGTRPRPDPRLASDAEVVGLWLDGHARAYPVAALDPSGSIVMDQMNGKRVVVLYDKPTHAAAAYAPEVEGIDLPQAVKLRLDETRPDAPFLDGQTGSHFGIEGRAVDGPLKGKPLRWLDSVQCKWFAWAAEYPKTDLYHGTNGQAARPISGVIVAPATATARQVAEWKRSGVNAVAVLLDEKFGPDECRTAAHAVSSAGLGLYYWIEVARNPAMAEQHPRWMASLGMHDDWRRRFPEAPRPRKDQVVKAYPWVPISHREAYDAHLQRIRELLDSRADRSYAGLLLNDLQGCPSSCGCGNLQCRWATDYHVPSTTTKLDDDDIAARFVSDVRRLAPGKIIVPIWMTECEDIDLPPKLAPGGKSTGLCGDLPCANSACPKVFTKQWSALLSACQGPIGVFAAHHELEREAAWVPRAVTYLDDVPPHNGGKSVQHQRLWLVIQSDEPRGNGYAQYASEELGCGAIFRTLVPLKQSFEPRIIPADSPASSPAPQPAQPRSTS